jgi:hypothetical protein
LFYSPMSKGRKIIAKLRNKYRLVLINDSSFAEAFSIRLTPFNVMMLFSSIFVLFTIIIFLLIAYTPMRQMVPGYGKSSDNSALMELNQKVEDMQRQIDNRELKTDALQKILSEKESELDTVSSKKGAPK